MRRMRAPRLRRLLPPIALAAAALSGCGPKQTQWVAIQEATLEFPLARGMRVNYFMGSPTFRWRGAHIGVGERSTIHAPYAPTLTDEIRRELVRFPHCVLQGDIREQTLGNGWRSASAMTLCHGHVLHPSIQLQVGETRYVASVTGEGPPLPEILEFLGTGREVPPERQAALLEKNKPGSPAGEIDKLSGGPVIRRFLLLGVLAWLALPFACVSLWRRRGIWRAAAVLLCLAYAVSFGSFMALLAFVSFGGVELFGFPGPVALAAVFAFMLVSGLACWLLARRVVRPAPGA